jgi:hypothetical protein
MKYKFTYMCVLFRVSDLRRKNWNGRAAVLWLLQLGLSDREEKSWIVGTGSPFV